MKTCLAAVFTVAGCASAGVECFDLNSTRLHEVHARFMESWSVGGYSTDNPGFGQLSQFVVLQGVIKKAGSRWIPFHSERQEQGPDSGQTPPPLYFSRGQHATIDTRTLTEDGILTFTRHSQGREVWASAPGPLAHGENHVNARLDLNTGRYEVVDSGWAADLYFHELYRRGEMDRTTILEARVELVPTFCASADGDDGLGGLAYSSGLTLRGGASRGPDNQAGLPMHPDLVVPRRMATAQAWPRDCFRTVLHLEPAACSRGP